MSSLSCLPFNAALGLGRDFLLLLMDSVSILDVNVLLLVKQDFQPFLHLRV